MSIGSLYELLGEQPPDDLEHPSSRARTRTDTAVVREESDSDYATRFRRLMDRTRTVTEVAREPADSDRAARLY